MEEQNSLDILNKKVGNKEAPRNTLNPAKVKIVSVVIQTKNKEDKKMATPLLKFMIKHPEREELLEIGKIKTFDGEKAEVKSCWIQTDDQGQFFKGSVISNLLNFLKVETLADTYGKEIETVTESKESPYLCLKAF